MTTPLQRYRQDLQQPGFIEDPAQALVVDHLQRLYDNLLHQQGGAGESLWQKLSFWSKSKTLAPVKGLYLWGGVGRGKTYLVDVFYDCLPFENKLRSHFHRFMRSVHLQLRELKGQINPLDQVAAKIASRARVICFDEFFVADITDAMLLANLLQGLFERGVILVATSNVQPDRLYENGLQRKNFLPAIDLLKQYTHVVFVDSPTDYRLRALDKAALYHSPLNDDTDRGLLDSFNSLAPMHATQHRDGVDDEIRTTARGEWQLEVEGRFIPVRRIADDVVWFDFEAICDGPRSQNDYMELAMEYHAVLISNVPVFDADNNDQARRFINLVDVFYDHNVKLVLSAAAPLSDLYQGQHLKFEFARTQSRLIEMQSHEYLAKPHRP